MIVRCGVIQADETWTGEIRVRGDIVIPENVRVTVGAGSTISFDPVSAFHSDEKRNDLGVRKKPFVPEEFDLAKCYIIVQGAWEVLGDAENGVVIGNEGWGGGLVFHTGQECTVAYAFIRNATYGICGLEGSRTRIRRSVIARNAVGIFLDDARTSVIENSTVRGNKIGILSCVGGPADGAAVRITGNVVERNTASGVFCSGTGPLIRGNAVTGNDVGINLVACSGPRIENNEISGNRIGIYGREIVSARIAFNTLRGNSETAVHVQGMSKKIDLVNDTITHNDTGIIGEDVEDARIRDTAVTCGRTGITVAGTSDVRISGCTVQADRVGVRYDGQSFGSIEGTTIAGGEDADAVGIQVDGTAAVKITGNAIKEVNSGIQCMGETQVTVDGNAIDAQGIGVNCMEQAGGIIRDNTITGASEKIMVV